RRSGGAAGRRRSKRGGGAAASFKANALVQGVPRHQQRRSRRGADIERCTIRQLRCALSESCETCALSEPCETCCALSERRRGRMHSSLPTAEPQPVLHFLDHRGPIPLITTE